MSSVSSHWRAAPTCISPRTVAASPGSPRAPSSAPDRLRAAAGHAGIAVASPPRRPCSHTCTSRAPSTQRTRRPSACNGLPRHRPEAPVRHLPPILHSRLLLCTPPERAALRYAALSSPAGLVPVPGFTFPCAAVYALCLTASYSRRLAALCVLLLLLLFVLHRRCPDSTLLYLTTHSRHHRARHALRHLPQNCH